MKRMNVGVCLCLCLYVDGLGKDGGCLGHARKKKGVEIRCPLSLWPRDALVHNWKGVKRDVELPWMIFVIPLQLWVL